MTLIQKRILITIRIVKMLLKPFNSPRSHAREQLFSNSDVHAHRKFFRNLLLDQNVLIRLC